MALDKSKCLAHLREGEERLIGAKVLDTAEAVLRSEEPKATGFLDPNGREIAQGVLGALPGVKYKEYGGYPKADYQRLLIYPEFFLSELLEPPIRALEVTGDFPEGSVTHRDFLGAVLATGLKRDRVGDIILIPNGCQVVVADDVAEPLMAQLRQVHNVLVNVMEIDLEQLAVAPERVKSLSTTVASLRLDAVAAFGFGMSRTKMVREIKAGRLKLNWRQTLDPAKDVAVGDVISMRGRGRVTVEGIKGETRKGRIALTLTRTF